MLRLSAFLLFIVMTSQASALTFKSGESLPSASKQEVGQADEIVDDISVAHDEIDLPKYEVSKVNFNNGSHYKTKFKVNGKYAIPLKSLTSTNFGVTGPDRHEYRVQLDSFMNNFYAVGDFNNDGVQDVVVTAFRAEEKQVAYEGDDGASVHQGKISKKRSFKVFAGDNRTGWANDYYKKGGKDITDIFIEESSMAGIADHQVANQKPLIADFNGDGVDDMYISSATRTVRSEKNNGRFFGGWHSYYLSQPDGSFKESSKEMMEGKWVERSTGRYTEFAHRSDVGDIDGDGDVDVIHTSVTWKGKNGYIICMYNDGAGRLTSKVCGDQWGNQVKIGDFNGDGHADIYIAGHQHECLISHKVKGSHSKARHSARIIFGNGSGKFYNRQGHKFVGMGKQQMANGQDIPLCGTPTAVIADVDNDGDQDIIGNTIGRLYVGGYFQIFLNNGSGKFSLGQQIVGKLPNIHYSYDNWPTHESRHESHGYCFNIHTIDLNDDGFLDFMCDSGFFQAVDGRVLINNGDGTFKDAPQWMINKFASIY